MYFDSIWKGIAYKIWRIYLLRFKVDLKAKAKFEHRQANRQKKYAQDHSIRN